MAATCNVGWGSALKQFDNIHEYLHKNKVTPFDPEIPLLRSYLEKLFADTIM